MDHTGDLLQVFNLIRREVAQKLCVQRSLAHSACVTTLVVLRACPRALQLWREVSVLGVDGTGGSVSVGRMNDSVSGISVAKRIGPCSPFPYFPVILPHEPAEPSQPLIFKGLTSGDEISTHFKIRNTCGDFGVGSVLGGKQEMGNGEEGQKETLRTEGKQFFYLYIPYLWSFKCLSLPVWTVCSVSLLFLLETVPNSWIMCLPRQLTKHKEVGRCFSFRGKTLCEIIMYFFLTCIFGEALEWSDCMSANNPQLFGLTFLLKN